MTTITTTIYTTTYDFYEFATSCDHSFDYEWYNYKYDSDPEDKDDFNEETTDVYDFSNDHEFKGKVGNLTATMTATNYYDYYDYDF
jgi:hypothetical protein